jgi:hypothetical protein
MSHRNRRNQRKRGWQDKLTTTGVATACGMAVNDLSGTLGYRGLAGVFAVLGVAAAATWIRRHKRTGLSRPGPWLFLVPAAAAASAATVSAGPWPQLLTVGAVILIMGAILLASDLGQAAELLGRTALAGLALVFCRAGAFSLADQKVPGGIALLLIGLAFAATGLLLTAGRAALLGAGAICLGLGFIGLAVVLHANGHLPVSVALAGIGIGLISPGLALLFEREAASYMTIIAGGAVVAGSGVVLIAGQQQALAGAAVLGLGGYLVIIGAACLAGRRTVGYAMVILAGVTVVAGGVPWHSGRQVLLLAPVVIGGLAAIITGMAETDPSALVARIRPLIDPPAGQPRTRGKRARR